MKYTLVFVLLIGMIVNGYSVQVQASPGISIMPAEVRITDPLIAGDNYHLPMLQVNNSGDMPSRYEIEITKAADQIELQPAEDFIFISPKQFRLKPGEFQTVSLILTIPVKATPGDYLAYIEAHPVPEEEGGAQIGIAVATKVYFTVETASMWQAMTHSIGSFFKRYSVIFIVAASVIVLGWLIYFLKHQFRLEFKLSRKNQDTSR